MPPPRCRLGGASSLQVLGLRLAPALLPICELPLRGLPPVLLLCGPQACVPTLSRPRPRPRPVPIPVDGAVVGQGLERRGQERKPGSERGF